MNDFTKEELETLFTVMDDNKNDCGHDDELIDKLQSLIDNYYKHDQYTPVLGDVDCYQCDKCNEII